MTEEWPRASEWLAGESHDTTASLIVMGAPLHVASITPGRCDLAPAAIREALGRFSTWDGGVDIRTVRVGDIGDFTFLADSKPEDAFDPLAGAVKEAFKEETDAVVLLGGDNSVTRPGVHGRWLERCGLLTLDAHHDLRETEDGLSNGNPIRALLEDGLPGKNIVQVGIQPFANSPAHAAVARDAGITVVPVEEVRARGIEDVISDSLEYLAGLGNEVSSIYVDLDVDVLDRSFAPACAGSRPGGLVPADLLTAARLAGRHPKVQAVDIVEVDPERDVADITALNAAACILAFASGLASRA